MYNSGLSSAWPLEFFFQKKKKHYLCPKTETHLYSGKIIIIIKLNIKHAPYQLTLRSVCDQRQSYPYSKTGDSTKTLA